MFIKKHNNFLQNKNKGFTLVELLLYVGIISILMLGISAFLSVLLSARVKNQTISEVDTQGFEVVRIIQQTIHNANSITSPATSTVAGSLILTMTSSTLNPTSFTSSSGVLYITEGNGQPVPLTNSHVNLSNLIFSNISLSSTPGAIRFMFTLTRQNLSGRNEYDYTRTFVGSASLRFP